ncbi:MAG: MotA/TolQ/ExbB proton channel family protein [Kiritimatiellae bacterium]|nr:MotA/TolQ/ExbB proton channel family protein [Kiritimatiellia bacterium]
MKKQIVAVALALALAVWMKGIFAQEAAKAAEGAAAQQASAEVAAAGDGAGTDASADGAPKEISGVDQWKLYWQQGGKTMYFIALLSILGIGCALERFFNLRRAKVVPEGFTQQVIDLWKAGKTDEVAALCRASKSMLSRVVETMLQHRGSADYQEVKMFAEDKVGRELRLENRKAAMLSTAATISPLLGLFGTVVGLLGAFGTVAAMGEMGDASVLADDIGKALVTTVAGLAVSMPCLFVFGLIKNRLNLYAVLLEEEVADLVNQLFVRK